MSNPSTGSQSPQSQSASQQRQLASQGWNFILAIVFSAIAEYQELEWTPWVVKGLLLLVLFWTVQFRLYAGHHQLRLVAFYGLASGICLVTELWLIAKITQAPPQIVPLVEIADAATGDLPGSYAGFREQATGGPLAVVLTIEEILPQPSGARFRYSMMEGVDLDEGEGQLYTTTKTLEFKDRTRLRYQKENGKIILWSITGSKLRLTRRDPF